MPCKGYLFVEKDANLLLPRRGYPGEMQAGEG
jgi:hypothetical protein